VQREDILVCIDYTDHGAVHRGKVLVWGMEVVQTNTCKYFIQHNILGNQPISAHTVTKDLALNNFIILSRYIQTIYNILIIFWECFGDLMFDFS
jgi:hypothetical protein